MKKFATIFVFVLFILYAANAENITILHINDTHSNLSPGGSRNESLDGSIGGIARVATIIKQAKASNPKTIVLHAGDATVGDIFFNAYLGYWDFRLLTQIGVDVMTLGNHEFDLGPINLISVLTSAFTDEGSSFPLISANFNKGTVDAFGTYVQPYTSLEVGNTKIGIIGLTTDETNSTSSPSPCSFSGNDTYIETINTYATSLKNDGCEYIILLSHLGFATDNYLAYMVPEGIDLIIGGHDHIPLTSPMIVKNMFNKDIPIVQAGAFFHYIGKFELDIEDGVVNSFHYTLIPLTQNIEEDSDIKLAVDNIITDIETNIYGQSFYTQKIAEVTETFEEISSDLTEIGTHDAEVSDFVTDAYLDWGKTDIAITSSGLTAQPLYQGPIVSADIMRMLGYGFNEINTLGYRMCTFKALGSQILAGINFGLSYITYNDEMLIQVAGMKYNYGVEVIENDTDYGFVVTAEVGGEAIDPEKSYSVTTNEYILLMFQLFLGIQPTDIQLADSPIMTEYMVVENYAKTKNTVSPIFEETNRINCVQINKVEDNNTPVSSNRFSIYPNPCQDLINLNFDNEVQGKYQIRIFNSIGTEVIRIDKSIELSENNSNWIDLSTLAPGMYSIQIISGEGINISKFIISR